MRHPSLDSLLIDLADRALAYPQRRGYTLPGMLNAFMAFCLGGILVETAVCLGNGEYDFAALAGFAFARFFSIFMQYGTVYRKLDAEWGPGSASIYRNLALHHREALGYGRLLEISLVGIGLSLSLICFCFMHWATALAYILPLFAAGAGSRDSNTAPVPCRANPTSRSVFRSL